MPESLARPRLDLATHWVAVLLWGPPTRELVRVPVDDEGPEIQAG